MKCKNCPIKKECARYNKCVAMETDGTTICLIKNNRNYIDVVTNMERVATRKTKRLDTVMADYLIEESSYEDSSYEDFDDLFPQEEEILLEDINDAITDQLEEEEILSEEDIEEIA